MGFTKVPIVLGCLIVTIQLMSCANLGLSALIRSRPRDFVRAHNPSRAELGLPRLVWNETVADFARNYANQRSGDCALQHSEGFTYGENIAVGTDLTARQAVELWVEEKSFYNYGSNNCVGGECRHYTAIIWRDTKSIGCARAICNNGLTFVTCNYYPPGNYVGQRPY